MNNYTDIDQPTDRDSVRSPDSESFRPPEPETRPVDRQPTLTDWNRRQPLPPLAPDENVPPDTTHHARQGESAPSGQNYESEDTSRSDYPPTERDYGSGEAIQDDRRQRPPVGSTQYGQQTGRDAESYTPPGAERTAYAESVRRSDPDAMQYADSDGYSTGYQPRRELVDPLDTTWFNYALIGFGCLVGGWVIFWFVSLLLGVLLVAGGAWFGAYAVYRDVRNLEDAGVWTSPSPMMFAALVVMFSFIPLVYYIVVRRNLTNRIALEQSVPRPMN